MKDRQEYKKVLRKRQNRKLFFYIKSLLIGLSVVALITFIFYIVFASPLFKISSIKISGNKTVKTIDLYKNVKYVLGERYFFASINTSTLEKTFPIIKSVTISKGFPNSIEINVLEYPPFALVQTTSGTYVISENGVVIDKVPNSSTAFSLPLVVSNQDDKSKILMPQIAQAIKVFESDKHAFIVGFTYSYPYDLLITYSDAHTVLISLNKDPNEELATANRVYKSVGMNACKNLDIRFDNIYCSK